MATTKTKQPFATRLSPETLSQLDGLVSRGRFKNRTEAIEAAVSRLVSSDEEELARRRSAFERSSGVLSIGITSESFKAAEYDRLDYEAERNSGRAKQHGPGQD
jgi:Arc/MetJ-type ribon-helix-helix transcriptional regulator